MKTFWVITTVETSRRMMADSEIAARIGFWSGQYDGASGVATALSPRVDRVMSQTIEELPG